jgi:hypothetical protein
MFTHVTLTQAASHFTRLHELFWKKTSMHGVIIYQVQFVQWLGLGEGGERSF